jgi:hypothetical protein
VLLARGERLHRNDQRGENECCYDRVPEHLLPPVSRGRHWPLSRYIFAAACNGNILILGKIVKIR